MNVLSLFDGISVGQLALSNLGARVDNYFASEIDKYAIAVTKHNFPSTQHIGSVTEVNPDDLPTIDLLIGGSPCSDFSFSGKRQGMVTKDKEKILSLEQYLKLKEEGFEFEGQSYLFWEYIRLLRATKPKYFFLENVVMKKEWETILSEQVGLTPTLINSSLLTAQNRKRLYWVGRLNEETGLYEKVEFPQPEDRGILLRDIIEDGDVDREKFLTVTTRVAGAAPERYLKKSMHQMIKVTNVNPSGNGMKGNVYSIDGKAPTLTTNKGEGVKITGGAQRGRYDENGNINQQIEVRDDEKSNCLTTVQKDTLVCFNPASIVGRRISEKGTRDDYNKDVPITQCLQVKHSDGKSGCLTTVSKDNVLSIPPPGRYEDIYAENNENIVWRKLTPVECERLQSIEDNFTALGIFETKNGLEIKTVSNSQRYKMLGNSWTCAVIEHIFSFMLREELNEERN